MTTTAPITTVTTADFARTLVPRSHGVDRAIERIGVTLVNWSRGRTSRATVSAEEYIRLSEVDCMRERRETDALHLTQRMGL
ncbi:MAG: hypothetical protein ABIW32_01125 [Terrimesophilobacter sp.]